MRICYWKSSSGVAINNCNSMRIVAASQFNQHEHEILMSESYSLPTEPEGIVASLVERFNSGKVT
jgi:hypothetical protein